MHEPRSVAQLVGSIYSMVAQPDGLDAVLRLLADSFDARSCALMAFDPAAHRASISAITDFPVEDQRRYHEHYWRVDEWRIGAERARLAPGQIVPDTAFLSHRAFRASEIWNEHLKPLDRFQWMGGTVARSRGIEAVVSIHRGRLQPLFGSTEVTFMKALSPHLRRTVTAIHRLQRNDAWGAVFDALSEHIPVGVVTLLADARIGTMNASAREICAARDGLIAGRQGLSAPRAQQRQILSQKIGLAVATGLGTSDAGGATVVIPRSSGRRAYVLDIVPVSSPPVVYPHERVAAMVLITDPERELDNVEARLMPVLGLSDREARLVAQLSAGRALDAAAQTLGLTLGTARTYLKHVFQKTGTHRQSELVALARRLGAINHPMDK